jgi:hypothetical protein
MNFAYKIILHKIKKLQVEIFFKHINVELQRGSPIRPHVKLGRLVTHPARVADVDDSNFLAILTAVGSGKYS